MNLKEIHSQIKKLIEENNIPIYLLNLHKYPHVVGYVEKGLPLEKKKIFSFNKWTISLKVPSTIRPVDFFLYSKHDGSKLNDEIFLYEPFRFKDTLSDQTLLIKIEELLNFLLGPAIDLRNNPIVYKLYPKVIFNIVTIRTKKLIGETTIYELGRINGKDLHRIDHYHYDFDKNKAYRKEGFVYDKEDF